MILGAYLFLLTPVMNTIIRTSEYEADMFGLNAARQPDGFAEAALLLGDYRKLDPSVIEEIVFFDHPGGRTRIRAAMQWKANQNLVLPVSRSSSFIVRQRPVRGLKGTRTTAAIRPASVPAARYE